MFGAIPEPMVSRLIKCVRSGPNRPFAGVPATVVADWMGHADKGATLLRTYAHVIRQHSAVYAKRVSYSPPQAA